MMFITHFKSSKAAKDYHAHLSQGDYFGKEAPNKAIYQGRTAELLGIAGMEVTKEGFYALCENRHPIRGEKLTSRDRDDARIMTDLTIDTPKAVTLAALKDERIDGVIHRTRQETLDEIENVMCVRVRKHGQNDDRVTGNGLYIIWDHETTRQLEDGKVDPHKHGHVTWLNVSYDPVEEELKATQWGNIVRDKGYFQAAWHARLAAGLKDLGYGIKKDGNSFTLAGIDRATVEKFSRRSDVIGREAERLGITDAKAKGDLGRKTREKKSKRPQSMAELHKEWDARLTPEERLALVTARQGFDKGDAAITPEQAKEYALEHSFERASAVSEKKLKEEALKYAVGSLKPEDVADMARHPEAIAERHNGQLFVTTKTVLRDEIGMLQFAKDGQRKFRPFAVGEMKGDALAGLSDEQKKAAIHILLSRDTVTGVVGKAGTGKTTMMRATRDAIESEPGRHVYAFAPSSQASRGVLAKEGFKDATTLETLLSNEQMQQQVKGQVIWVDEAGQVSSRDMKRLMDVVKKGNNRLILSGDYTQHSSVEAGDAFRLLEKEAGVRFSRLSEVRRQTTPGYKKAVEQISKGSGISAQKGFDALDKMGWVVEAGKDERHGLLVEDYLQAQQEGRSALIIAPTHVEGQKLTDELRTTLKERGALGKEHSFTVRESMDWTNAQKGDVRNYAPGIVLEFNKAVGGTRKMTAGIRKTEGGFKQGERAVVAEDKNGLYLQKEDGKRAALPLTQAKRFGVYRTREIGIAKGDRIRVTKNGEAKVEGQAKGARINNGDIYTVHGFTKEGDIRLDKGRVLPKDWGHMSMGYVDTSYASQGKTVDRVFIAVGNQSLSAANQQQWYVSASRGREMAKVYVEDKQDVRDAIARTGQRLSAVELTHTRLRSSWRDWAQQAWERSRARRFVEATAQRVAAYVREQGRGREGVSYV